MTQILVFDWSATLIGTSFPFLIFLLSYMSSARNRIENMNSEEVNKIIGSVKIPLSMRKHVEYIEEVKEHRWWRVKPAFKDVSHVCKGVYF